MPTVIATTRTASAKTTVAMIPCYYTSRHGKSNVQASLGGIAPFVRQSSAHEVKPAKSNPRVLLTLVHRPTAVEESLLVTFKAPRHRATVRGFAGRPPSVCAADNCLDWTFRHKSLRPRDMVASWRQLSALSRLFEPQRPARYSDTRKSSGGSIHGH